MEKFMLKAHELQAQGFTQKQIAEQLEKTDRTIRTWLKQMPRKRKTPVRKSLLDEYKPFVEARFFLFMPEFDSTKRVI